jgi:hypothetical protein
MLKGVRRWSKDLIDQTSSRTSLIILIFQVKFTSVTAMYRDDPNDPIYLKHLTVQNSLDSGDQRYPGKWFFEGSLSTHGLGHFQKFCAGATAAGHGDDFNLWVSTFEFRDDIKTGLLGHSDVGYDQICRSFMKAVYSLIAVESLLHVVAFNVQHVGNHFQQWNIIFDQKYIRHTAFL